MAASWPTSVASDSTLYIAVNELQNNLSGAINSAVTTIGLNSTTGFPSVGLVLIDNEVIKYGGISGNNLTSCTRAFDGTTAAAHSSAAVVSFAFCAAHHNNLKDEVIAIETSLNLTASRALSSDVNGRVAIATTTLAELNFLSGVTSAVQTQLNGKASTDLSNVASVSANVPMNAKKFTGLAAGSGAGDSVRYEQVLLLSGGTMSGAIAMGTSKITGLGNGTAATDAAAFGQLTALQVVQGTYGTQTSTTSTSYLDTGISVTITPKLTTSHVLLDFDIPCGVLGTSAGGAPTMDLIITDSSNVTVQEYLGVYGTNMSSTQPDIIGQVRIRGWDAPGSTSAKTYKVRVRVNTNSGAGTNTVRTCVSGFGQSTAFFTATEFA